MSTRPNWAKGRNLSHEHAVSHRLEGHSGSPIEGCPTCNAEVDELKRIQRRVREKGKWV